MGLYDRLTPGNQNKIDEEKRKVPEDDDLEDKKNLPKSNKDVPAEESAEERFVDRYGPEEDNQETDNELSQEDSGSDTKSPEERFVDRYGPDSSTSDSPSSPSTDKEKDSTGRQTSQSPEERFVDRYRSGTDTGKVNEKQSTGKGSDKDNTRKGDADDFKNILEAERERQRAVIQNRDVDIAKDTPPSPGARTVNVPGTGNRPQAQVSRLPFIPPEQARVGIEYPSGTNIPGVSYLNQQTRPQRLDISQASISQLEDLKIDSTQAGLGVYNFISPQDRIDPTPGRDLEGTPVNPFSVGIDFGSGNITGDAEQSLLPTEEVENEVNTPVENIRETTGRTIGTGTTAASNLINTPITLAQVGLAATDNTGATAAAVAQGSRSAVGTQGLGQEGFGPRKIQAQAGWLELVGSGVGSSLARRGTVRGITTSEDLTDIARNPVRPDPEEAGVDVNIERTIQARPERTNPELQRVLAEMDLEGTRGPAGSGRGIVVEGEGENTFAQRQDLLQTKISTENRDLIVTGRTASVGEAQDGSSEGLVASEFQAISENQEILDPRLQSSERMLMDFSAETDLSRTDRISGAGPTGEEVITKTESKGTGQVAGEPFEFTDETEIFSSPEGDADLVRSRSILFGDDSKTSTRTEGVIVDESQIGDDVRKIERSDDGGSTESGETDFEDLEERIGDLMDQEEDNVFDDTVDDAADDSIDVSDNFDENTGQSQVLEDSTASSRQRKGTGTDAVNVKAFKESVAEAVRFEGQGGTAVKGTGIATLGEAVQAAGISESIDQGLQPFSGLDQGVNQDNIQDSVTGQDQDIDNRLVEEQEQRINQLFESQRLTDNTEGPESSLFRSASGRGGGDGAGKGRRVPGLDFDRGRDLFRSEPQEDVSGREKQRTPSIDAVLFGIEQEEEEEQDEFTGFETRGLL